MSGKRMSMQEWLLSIDPLYLENYQATLKANSNGSQGVELVLRYQFNAAKRRAKQAGLLDEEGRMR